ncbi:MAG: polysaccharide deacetylase family protein, partial [Thermodesulfobacteriota bacterium]
LMAPDAPSNRSTNGSRSHVRVRKQRSCDFAMSGLSFETAVDNSFSQTLASLTAGWCKPENSAGKTTVFFRADDIGVPGRNYLEMMELFDYYKLPICLALVPAWLTHSRFAAITDSLCQDFNRYSFHQHGYLHRNHELIGKKQEFGPSRTHEQLNSDLTRGKARLEQIAGPNFLPVFTPPWNRCSAHCLNSLASLGYVGLSRFSGASPAIPPGLHDLSVGLDLHTRKADNPDKDLTLFLTQLKKGLSDQHLGIMLHHQRMDRKSFVVLDSLLKVLSASNRIEFATFHDLVHPRTTK